MANGDQIVLTIATVRREIHVFMLLETVLRDALMDSMGRCVPFTVLKAVKVENVLAALANAKPALKVIKDITVIHVCIHLFISVCLCSAISKFAFCYTWRTENYEILAGK